MNTNYTTGIVLITGPINSGKSRFAEKILYNKRDVIYIATSQIYENDSVWMQKIKLHKQRRPSYWKLFESSLNLDKELNQFGIYNNILLDSLGGFVTSNLHTSNIEWSQKVELFLNNISSFKGLTVVVSEEVGWSICAETSIGNLFIDRISSLSDKIDNISTESWLVVHGRAINLSSIGIKI